jgi:hypothetical protein
MLYEKLLSYTPHSEIETYVSTGLNDSQIFFIDNVAEYYFMSEKSMDVLSDLPDIAPQFENMYFEYKCPPQWTDGGNNTDTEYSGRIGVLISSFEINQNRHEVTQYEFDVF